MPDGSIPFLQIREWGCWVDDCVSLMDGDGTYRHWKYNGAYADQPWIDLQIYKVIRKRWVELRNDDMNAKFDNVSASTKNKRGAVKPRMGRKRR